MSEIAINLCYNMRMKTYKHILFDLDGTLSDPKVGITEGVDYALRSFGIETKDLNSLKKFIGPPLIYSFETFYGFDEEKAVKARDKYREYYNGMGGVYKNTMYDGIVELLETLKKDGKKLYVATSKPTDTAMLVLKHFKIDKYFDCVYGAELNEMKHEKKDIIEKILNTFKLTKLEEVVMIGDRMHDLIAASACNIDSIGVLYGYGDRDEFVKYNATCIVESVEELKTLLTKRVD